MSQNATEKGVRAYIYRWSLGDCSNGGISGRVDQVTVIDDEVGGSMEPTEYAPAVRLVPPEPRWRDVRPRGAGRDPGGEALDDGWRVHLHQRQQPTVGGAVPDPAARSRGVIAGGLPLIVLY
jgi:hypothetical protein